MFSGKCRKLMAMLLVIVVALNATNVQAFAKEGIVDLTTEKVQVGELDASQIELSYDSGDNRDLDSVKRIWINKAIF